MLGNRPGAIACVLPVLGVVFAVKGRPLAAVVVVVVLRGAGGLRAGVGVVVVLLASTEAGEGLLVVAGEPLVGRDATLGVVPVEMGVRLVAVVGVAIALPLAPVSVVAGRVRAAGVVLVVASRWVVEDVVVGVIGLA